MSFENIELLINMCYLNNKMEVFVDDLVLQERHKSKIILEGELA